MGHEIKLGEVFRNLRKDNGYSLKRVQQMLAEKGQVYCTSTIYKWEEGETQPDVVTVGFLCEIYNVNINYLFTTQKESGYYKLTDLEGFIVTRIRADKVLCNTVVLMLRLRFNCDRISKKAKKKFNEILDKILQKEQKKKK